MDQKNSAIDNLVGMQMTDRRRARRSEPPYITDEGFVLFDRRCEEDRPAFPESSRSLEPEAEAVLS